MRQTDGRIALGRRHKKQKTYTDMLRRSGKDVVGSEREEKKKSAMGRICAKRCAVSRECRSLSRACENKW